MSKRVPTLVAKHMRHGTEQGLMLLGVDLRDAKEEVFVRMVTDGISMGVAFARAGFKAKSTEAPYRLWQLDRIQQRAAAILEARRTTGVVTLPQVTSMLQRVYSSAYHADEFNAAHNAALSLARLYGHVNDRQTLEVIRRPSRDPDAPSEQELSSWVESLPALNAPNEFSHSSQIGSQIGPLRGAPAAPLSDGRSLLGEPLDRDTGKRDMPHTAVDWLASNSIASDTIEGDGIVAGQPENGAPTPPVTGTPDGGGHAAPLKPEVEKPPRHRGLKKKKVPRRKKQVPVPKRGKRKIPSAKDLFG